MSRTINWNARAVYLIVALVMTLGSLLVPAGTPVLAQIDPDLFALEPSLALNVKGAVEEYAITYDGSPILPGGVNITEWRVLSVWTYPIIVDGGQPGDVSIAIQAAEPGDAIVFVDLDFNGDGDVDMTLDAMKKWGEISCTELTSESLSSNEYRATELVKADFYWGSENDIATLPAADAVINWWLMDIEALTDADNLNGGAGILDVEADLGDDPCDEDGGCGDWVWDPTKPADKQPNDPFYRINELQGLYPVDTSTAYLNDNPGQDYATSMSDTEGTAYMKVYAASPRTVLLVTLAEYPIDKHGENDECVQHETLGPNRPPDCSEAYAAPDCLWPPNHKFADISIAAVIDPDGDPVTITVLAILSDEPTATDKGSGGAKHAPDATGIGTDTPSVRSECSGKGDGRVYTIVFMASDDQGAECEGEVIVKVQHDQSDDCEAIWSGTDYDATQIN